MHWRPAFGMVIFGILSVIGGGVAGLGAYALLLLDFQMISLWMFLYGVTMLVVGAIAVPAVWNKRDAWLPVDDTGDDDLERGDGL